MPNNIDFYSDNAKSLVKQFDSVAFESLHKEWLSEIPHQGFVLDIGAGSGRDARYLASKGLHVVAVEPASGIRALAQLNSGSQSITWLNDSLPALNSVVALRRQFNLVLLSAVWMHVTPDDRSLAMQRMASLLAEDGLLVITLRYGAFADERTAHALSISELQQLAHTVGLQITHVGQRHSDVLGRSDIQWQTVCLRKEAINNAR